MLPTIFCPQCQRYLNPQTTRCPNCGWQRLQHERLPAPGQPLWDAQAPGAVFACSLLFDHQLVCRWGTDHGEGGLIAFDRLDGQLLWRFDLASAGRGGVTQWGERLYFGTLGFLGEGAAIYCLDQDGSLVWQQSLPGGARSAPVVQEARLFTGGADGRLRCFDSRNGEPVSLPASLPALNGELWLHMAHNTLLAFSRGGHILALDPLRLRPLWASPLQLEARITTPPCSAEGAVFFGIERGRLASLNVRARQWQVFAAGMKRLRATPLVANGLLLVAAMDHCLHAFDLESGLEVWKSPEFEHSIVTTPAEADGLVVTAVNGGEVACLELETGEVIWRYPMEVDRGLMADPLLAEGVVYAASDAGQVVALPWHLGRYQWAGDWLEAQRQWDAAATCHVIAACHTVSLQERQTLYDKAEGCWDSHGHPEKAARVWESMVEEQRAAKAYIRAADHQRAFNPKLAADYYDLAAHLLWRLGRYAETDTCNAIAAKLARWPLVRLKPWNIPVMVQGRAGLLSFRAENIGYSDAFDLYISLGGSLLRPVSCKVSQPLPPDSYFEIHLEIIPTRSGDILQVVAEYVESPARAKRFSTSLQPPITLEAGAPPHKIKMGDSFKGKLRIVNPQNQPVEFEMGDQLFTEVDIILGEDR